MLPCEFLSQSVQQTEEFAQTVVAPTLNPGDVVALFGPMGMGKTAFVRGLAKGLAIQDPVASPTFALVHRYRGNPALCHYDFYRMGGPEDLEDAGFYDGIERGDITVTEWSEMLIDQLPPNRLTITIAPLPQQPNGRLFTLCDTRTGQKEGL